MKDAVASELLLHATEELARADLIANRIIQLGGKPIIEPKLWYQWSGCGYDAPTNEYVKVILEQNIKGERCAIGYYNELKIVDVKDKLFADSSNAVMDAGKCTIHAFRQFILNR